MRFFTPELYARFNSADEDEADDANEAWEAALARYRNHLDGIRDRMPSQVRKLAELDLHDAEFLGCDQEVGPLVPAPSEAFPQPVWSAVAILSVKQDDTIVSLIYLLWDRVREYPAAADWPFSKARTHWLYDEVDLAPDPRGMFLHRVLLSDGRVLEIPFASAIIHSLSLAPPDGRIRQSA
jgi:hypothetical protein